MSSEIYNNNYTKSIYNLRLNTINFTSNRGKIWYKSGADIFEREQVDNVPIDTKAKIFSNELIRMIDNKQITPQKVQQAVTKYLPNTDVRIISMDDYTEFGLNNKKRVAAATRPTFDKNGVLQKIEIYIPQIDYDDEDSKLEFIDKLTHEITHAMQFAGDKTVREQYKNTKEGRFYNFFQQNVANMLTDVFIPKILVEIAREKQIEMYSIEDYNRFVSSPMDYIDEEKIFEYSGCKNKKEFNNFIKAGFITFIDELMRTTQVSRDPFAMEIIDKTGGVEAFRSKIMKMTAHQLAQEQEAYKNGNNARKSARGFTGDDYNDVIPLAVGMAAEALNS